MHFVQDDETALKILRAIELTPVVKDYNYHRLLAKFWWYRGESTEKTITPLLKQHETIRSHRRQIANRCKPFTPSSCSGDLLKQLDELDYRERRAELNLINNVAYYISDDIARQIKDANRYAAI